MGQVTRFTAKFDSDGDCGHKIEEGTEAGYVDGETFCEDCCDDAEVMGNWDD